MRKPGFVFIALFLSASLQAEDAALPDLLSLSDALQLSRQDVPLVLQARAAQELAEAQLLSAQSESAATLGATVKLQAIEPSRLSINNDPNNSYAALALRKRLYDFGYTSALETSAKLGQDASKWTYKIALQQQHLAVMRAFYDVILSDLEYARDNEAMSTGFIRADRARDRNELGQLSDVTLLELQAVYQETRRKRFASERRQRLTRSQLAINMGRPNDLASDLVMPQIVLPEKKEADFELFWQQVLNSSPVLLAIKSELLAAQEQLVAARASNGPVLSAELDAAAYNRLTGSTHPLSAGLVFSLPVFDGGKKNAAITSARANKYSVEAKLAQAQLNLRQEALSLWLQREDVRTQIEELTVLADFRDLYLDRSRAYYELELKTDLGDAMAQTSAVRLRMATSLFEWKLIEAKMQAMTGQLLAEEQK